MGKKIVALLTILAIIFTVAICTPDSNAGIQTLNLSKQTKEIKVGESFQLTMTGVKASSIKWKSSKPSVATINKKGVIKGVKVGTTNITGKYKSLKFTIKVVVKKKQDKTTEKTTESTTEGTTEKTTETPKPVKEDDLNGMPFVVKTDYAKLYYENIGKIEDTYFINFMCKNTTDKTIYAEVNYLVVDDKSYKSFANSMIYSGRTEEISFVVDEIEDFKTLLGTFHTTYDGDAKDVEFKFTK